MRAEPMFHRSRYDALVVGARCAGAATAMLEARGRGARGAGAATAMLMARCGLKVLVSGRGSSAADTISTHALMRPGVMQLFRWGLLPRIVAAGTPAVCSTVFHYGGDVLEGEIRPSGGGGARFPPRPAPPGSNVGGGPPGARGGGRAGCT